MRKIAIVLILMGVGNFLLFMFSCINLGGSAGNGEIVDGRYFVAEHGRKTEVEKKAFELNRMHGRSLLVTHPLAMIGMLLLASGQKRSSRSPSPVIEKKNGHLRKHGRLM